MIPRFLPMAGYIYDMYYHNCQNCHKLYYVIPSEARLYSGSIEICRRRHQPEVGLTTLISQDGGVWDHYQAGMHESF